MASQSAPISAEKSEHVAGRHRREDEGRRDDGPGEVDLREQVLLPVALRRARRRRWCPPMLASPITAIATAPERRGRGDPEPREHAVRRDRRADLGDEGREVRGDEAELVAAGEEADEDQEERRIADRPADDRAHALLAAPPPARGDGPRDQRQQHQHREDRPAKTRKTGLHGITPSSASATGGPTNCPAEPAAVAIPRRQRPPLRRGGAPDDGEDHAEAGAGDAEADQHVEQLVRARRHRVGREHQPERRRASAPSDDRLAVAEALGDRRRRSAGRSPRRGSGWRSPARSPPAASRSARRSGSGRRRRSPGCAKPTSRIRQPATRRGVRGGDLGSGHRRARGESERRILGRGGHEVKANFVALRHHGP